MESKRNRRNRREAVDVRLSADSPFQIAEAYKTVRTNLLFSLAAQKHKTVVVSSALPGEGKSTTCSNLAIAMAQTAARVLIVDADLRKPTQYKIFKRSSVRGLSRLLVGFDSLHDSLMGEVEPNLDLITSGPIPPNPSELLSSEQMKALLDLLEEQYDYIFIDTPPINVVTDAMVLANLTAGILLVTRQGQSTYDELNRAISSIEFSGSNILGMIVTEAGEKSGGYSNYKYRYRYDYSH